MFDSKATNGKTGLRAEWTQIQDLHKGRSPLPSCTDTEFVHIWLVELTILDSAGNIILSTKVVRKDHDWAGILANCGHGWDRVGVHRLSKSGFDKYYKPAPAEIMNGFQVS